LLGLLLDHRVVFELLVGGLLLLPLGAALHSLALTYIHKPNNGCTRV
jgi:hypothetical protein